MSSTGSRRVVLAAVGSECRGDDAAGPAVLDRVGELGGVEMLGALASPLDLLGAWDGADLAIVVDAVDALDGVDAPGGVCVIDVDMASGPDMPGRTRSTASSHGLGLIDALRIAAAMGTAPERVLLVGVSGEDFGGNAGLSPAASGAVERAARRVVELAGAATAPSEEPCVPRGTGPAGRLGPRRTASLRRDHRL